MAETQLPRSKAARRRVPRLRAGRHLRDRHNFIGFHGHGLLALIFFAIISLSVLGVGLGVASLTIFAVGNSSPGNSQGAAATSPKASPSATNSSLIGQQIDGTIVGMWLDENLIAIQPAGGEPVQASVTAKSVLTRGGSTTTLGDLISGDAVVVTFGAGPRGTLVVVNLNDIETVPTNSSSGSLTPLPNVTPTPTPTPAPTPVLGPGPGPTFPVPSTSTTP